MFKKVIFRDRQELQANDLSNIEQFTDETIKGVVEDSISNSYHYTGFQVTQQSATEMSVSAGRLWADGYIYVSEQSQDFNLFQYLPLVTKKVVTVAIWGSEIESQVEPRDFLIDVVQGTTEPHAVAMQKIRLANINIVAGVESADPQPPALQENVVPVAYVYLNTTGIERIVRVSDYELPRLKELKADMVALQAWKAKTEPRLASIITDLAALSKKSEKKAELTQVLELASDMAIVKEKLNLPSSYHSYDSDHFGNTDKIDTDNTVALIDHGLLFPNAGEAVADLALFNPYDPNIKRFDNLILPKFDNVVKIKTEGYSGDISISQYQYQTHTIKKYTRYERRGVYGWRWNWYWKWYYWYYYGYYPYWWWNYWWWDWYGYWERYPVDYYKLETETQSINGAIIAQTFLVSSAMWLTALGLYFTQLDSSTNINIVICETDNGKPVLQKTLTVVTVSASDLKKYPEESVINLTPVFLNPGRYAICFITQGNYRVATVSGQNYLQGTLFFGTDGDYFTGDLTKDLMMKVYGAQFHQARTEVQLQPVSLSGGITDIDIASPAIAPEGSKLTYEIQVAGRWYPFTEVGHLSSAPDIVPLRVVFLGTGDIQPGLWLKSGAIKASRPATTFYATSTQRTLPASRDHIEVQLLLHGFDSTNHTVNCQLLVGADTHDASSVETKQEEDAIRKIYTFQITGGTNNYKIKISGSRASNFRPYSIVERIDIAY